MKLNIKLIGSTFLYELMGVIFITTSFLLNQNNIINQDNILINCIIFVATSIINAIILTYIVKKCRNQVNTIDLILQAVMYMIFFTLYPLCRLISGVHFSLFAIFAVSLLSLIVYNLIFILSKKIVPP